MPNINKKLDTLVDKVDGVIKNQKEIAKTETVILNAVATEEREEKNIEAELKEVEKVTGVQRLVLTKIKKHQILFPLVIAVGVVLVWRGLWGLFDQTPIVSIYVVSLLLGLFLLWLFNRLKSL